MLTLRIVGDEYRPVFNCDVCGEQISQSNGNVLWLPGDPAKTWHVHRGHCNRLHETDGKRYYWERIDVVLMQIVNNTLKGRLYRTENDRHKWTDASAELPENRPAKPTKLLKWSDMKRIAAEQEKGDAEYLATREKEG